MFLHLEILAADYNYSKTKWQQYLICLIQRFCTALHSPQNTAIVRDMIQVVKNFNIYFQSEKEKVLQLFS